MSEATSRPRALAAALLGADAPALESLFTNRRVLVRLERERTESQVAQEALLLAGNEILRFCPNLTVALPDSRGDLARAARTLATAIHGSGATLEVVALDAPDPESFDAVVNVGHEIRAHRAWIAVDASGWSARVATSVSGAGWLPDPAAPPTVFSALAAASLGAGQVFLSLVDRPLLTRPLELSLWSLETGVPGELDPGPPLPLDDLELDSLLVGCGGVTNGFAYAVARAPLGGRLEAVDKQSLRPGNLGAYVCATRSRLGMPKAEVIRDVLAPSVSVTPRNERLHFFKARIGYGQTAVPALVIAGLDGERARHDVQRLWAPVTVDMAAEELTAQLIVKDLADDGICLIGANATNESAPSELEELAAELGLPPERVADFESEITADDVAAAPPDKRETLEAARRRGERVCGRATDLDLHEEGSSGAFTPAVPFVTGFAGIVGAAQTARQLMGAGEGSIHFQFSFLSYRVRKMRMRCKDGCECVARRSKQPRQATLLI
ncbi:MAG: ThiF family adenylyltransferase [Actinomycetota bacterium]